MARSRGDIKIALVPDHQECVVWCAGRKISFVCTLPLAQEMQWDDLHGTTIDDRLTRHGSNLQPLRPLRQFRKGEWATAKKQAFGVLSAQRAKAVENLEKTLRKAARKLKEPLLFGTLPEQRKPPRNVA